MEKADIGVIGLAVMGRNLVLNLSDHGFHVAVYNRTSARTAEFLAGEAAGRSIAGSVELAELVATLKTPRVLLLMVQAGIAVDAVIQDLLPLLQPGDVIVDGGNSHYPDTVRRFEALKARGLRFLGMGISGGEEGARHGPSLMPGGDPEAWPLVKDMFQAIAAKADGEPCCQWVGEAGAGHYVKMVHNGIEYGLMAAYAEGFNILHRADAGRDDRPDDAETTPLRDPRMYQYQLDIPEIAEVWRRGSVIGSWLLDLTAHYMNTPGPNMESMKGRVSDSGEGRWTVEAAVDVGAPAPVITSALYSRFASRNNDDYANRVLSAMRYAFGGHLEVVEDDDSADGAAGSAS